MKALMSWLIAVTAGVFLVSCASEPEYLEPLHPYEIYIHDFEGLSQADIDEMNFMDKAYVENNNVVYEYFYCSKCDMEENLLDMSIIKPNKGSGRWVLAMTRQGALKNMGKDKRYQFIDNANP